MQTKIENSKAIFNNKFYSSKTQRVFINFPLDLFGITNTIFKIIQIQKNKLEILLGNFKTSIKE